MFRAKGNIKDISSYLNKQGENYSQAMREMRFLDAVNACEHALRIMPSNMTVVSDYALALMRSGQYMKAYKQYLKIYNNKSNNININWLDGLTEVCGWLNKRDELRRYGHESLSLADKKYMSGEIFSYPQKLPAFENNKEKNIISYSLYGDGARYCETLVKNTEICHELYPSWQCRVYLDNTVPDHVVSRLKKNDAHIVDMSGETVIPPTMWRFLVLDDESVSRFIVRDADSLLSEKEAAAVNQWSDSSFWFHHMRDYFTHSELLLAGMWGGCHGVFSNVRQAMIDFVSGYKGTARFTDQVFLKTVLWPTVRQSILNHDEIFLFHNPEPYPQHPPERWGNKYSFHIGSNVSYTELSGDTNKNQNCDLTISLIYDNDQYSYKTRAVSGKWSLNIPFFILEDVRSSRCKISVNESAQVFS